MIQQQNWEELAGEAHIAEVLAGHQLAHGEQLCHASLVLHILFVSLFSFPFSFVLNCIYLNRQVLFIYFFFCLTHSFRGEGSE